MSAESRQLPIQDLLGRFIAFVAERHPWALDRARQAFLDAGAVAASGDAASIGALRRPLAEALDRLTELPARGIDVHLETTAGVLVAQRLEAARRELREACDGFLRRQAIAASLTVDERLEMLRGMIITRAVDNRLKTFFLGGEVRWGKGSFQGKGFRSLGQEAIYGAALRLRRGPAWRDENGWHGDVIAPMIRDLGAVLAMRPEAETVRRVLSAQMGKAGPPMDGKDLHLGDPGWGIFPPSAPLGNSVLATSGIAFAMAREARAGEEPVLSRVVINFVGEGSTSLGEWHEALNLCAVHRLPAVFCVQNNQTALSTPLRDQSAVRVFADKAAGYGVPGITVDGTDPEAVAAAFAWAVERAREGAGPTLVELEAMRMCGHAHHDDMLYLGHEPKLGWEYPEPDDRGYVDRQAWDFWAHRDPIARYAGRLRGAGLVSDDDVEQMKVEATALVEEQAREVIEAPWPEPAVAGAGVFAGEPPRHHAEVLDERPGVRLDRLPGLPEPDPGPPFDRAGRTFLDAVTLGVADALRADDRVFVYGEDVGGRYGNAFLLLRPLLAELGDRLINSPLTEAGTLGLAAGAALEGLRPIAEIQFNDFVAGGFNQLVNNIAKIRYRWGGEVPMVVRMPWGGLRKAGPFHSQNTEAWFYRTPGLKIVAPSTPHDARALLAAAVADPDPVLYYEHIALYRDPRIKQRLSEEPPEPLPLGRAALRRAGSDLAIVSYGAYVHVALRVAERLAASGLEAAVLDLRSLVPLDREALLRVARCCAKVLILQEDSRQGSIGESLAAVIQEEAFEYLDAPVRVLGALDAPVPYSPPLEEAFLVQEDQVERAARLLAAY